MSVHIPRSPGESLRTGPPGVMRLAGWLVWALTMAPALVSGQTPETESRPDPAKILEAALAVHRGTQPRKPLESLRFKGTVRRRSPEGDVNDAEVEQWFEPGTDRPVIVTRIEVTGPRGTRVSVRGFDGKRHFVVIQGKKTIIDGNRTYRKDEESIKQDRELTRFLVEQFLAGRILRPGIKLRYLGRQPNQQLLLHKIAHVTPKGKTTLFYVNARAGEKAYFFGIEYPAHAKLPKVNYCFWDFHRFGRFTVPRQIKVYENDGARPASEVYIKDLEVNAARRPAWAGRARKK